VKWFKVMVARFGGVGLPGARQVTRAAIHPAVPLVAAIIGFADFRTARESLRTASTSLLTFALMSAGYFAVYLTTRQALEWHAQYSMERLLMQLWPILIFSTFLLLAPADAALTRPVTAQGPTAQSQS
jgi:hypothetical protein